MDKALALEGISVQSVLTVIQVSLAVAFARTGLALSFVPRHIFRNDVKAGVLKAALIDYPSLLNTRFVLCRHKSRAPTLPAQAFLMALQRQFISLDAEVRRPRARRKLLRFGQRRDRNSLLFRTRARSYAPSKCTSGPHLGG
jgi:hypothetical protein